MMKMALVSEFGIGQGMLDVSAHLTEMIKGGGKGVVISFFVDGAQRGCLVGQLEDFRDLIDKARLKES